MSLEKGDAYLGPSLNSDRKEVLDDLMFGGAKVVFCGTAAGSRSAQRRLYYARPGNKFWAVLAASGMVTRLLSPEEFRSLADFGIGLTDLAKYVSGADSGLNREEFDVTAFLGRVDLFKPRIVAFNGKEAAAIVLKSKTRDLKYGIYPASICTSKVFILPSTSGRAQKYWDPQPWFKLSEMLRQMG